MTDQQQHPTTITPPPELKQQWREQAPRYRDGGAGREEWLIDRAAQWGYDQRGEVNEAQLRQARDEELEACCDWLREAKNHGYGYEFGAKLARKLRAARRPKPPSLKEQACDALDAYIYGNPDHNDKQNTYNTIRRALEALPND